MQNQNNFMIAKLLLATCVLIAADAAHSAAGEKPAKRKYEPMIAAPASQTADEAQSKSAGCLSCHTETDEPTMHISRAVQLGCIDCHGGDSRVFAPQVAAGGASETSPEYQNARDRAHVLPLFPKTWHYPHSANPERTYTLLNKESREFIRFVNPSDYRIAELACGACHLSTIEKSIRSMHSTGAMLWGGASYNNGILPFKNYILGEAYTADGQPAVLKGPKVPAEIQAAVAAKGVLPQLLPMPAWEVVKPGDIFRVFEDGGRNILSLFPETAIPNSLGLIQRLEEPGRPDNRQSNRGPGTGARISVPVINIHKTRLNDPFTWFMGTNDQPGDYRNSGCASCHVVYANDRDPRHSGGYARFGHDGETSSIDPTIPHGESGHPVRHTFTNAIPTSQCMICHMHQPNMFLNSFLGYTMWDYESDAPRMWPQEQVYPTTSEMHDVLERNPEGASPRGKWADVEFLKSVWDKNPQMQDTQFADYHGHGWNFRAIFKRDRDGNLLDSDGNMVADTDPAKFEKAVHMSSIHVDVGMHCVDCHFSQDNHGNGHIYGEVALAIEIDCKDCHGTATQLPNLFASGPAAIGGGTDLEALRTPDGRKRFEWVGEDLYQRSSLDLNLEWKLSLVKNTVSPGHSDYNEKAARAKLMSEDTETLSWGVDVGYDQLAHSDEEIECYTCHTSWTTSCGGCHLPTEANRKTTRHHYEGGESRNYATYNPQVARDQMFLLGRRGDAKGGKIAPVRSSSALVLSSTNLNRERIYIQQPPIAASGFSSQAFNPHFPHTVRLSETKTCDDCHLSAKNDNNAIMAQLLMFGTNFVNFVGLNAWIGGDGEVSAVQVTEWDEPQAVIGSYLHRYAYPDWYSDHQKRGRKLATAFSHDAGEVGCLQLRGEYLYVAESRKGFRAYDVANVGNKGFSQRIVTSPFSGLGQDTRVDTKNATCVALPTNQPIHPDRNQGPLMRDKDKNAEQPFHPIYNYAVVTDSKEGLVLVDVNTLADGEFRNNKLRRALTWNPNGALTGVRHITLGGYYAYLLTNDELIIVSLDRPLEPDVVARMPLDDARASTLQFRYLFVTDREGLKVVDVTDPTRPRLTQNNTIRLADARRVYVARTYAYVAAGREGLVIVDVKNPEAMKLEQAFTGGGALADSRDVVVATTNASLFAYVADGDGGLKVVQLTSPESQPKFYGFSPAPRPEIIATYRTGKPALSLSKGLDRDRGVDETGGQIAVFGRRGSRPLNTTEMRRLYLDDSGKPWYVDNDNHASEDGDDIRTAAEPSRAGAK